MFSTESYEVWIKKRMFTKQEKDKLFEVYKDLKFLIWNSNKLEMEYSEKDFVNWIIDVVKFWDSNKHKIKDLCEKTGRGWKEYKLSSVRTKYHG